MLQYVRDEDKWYQQEENNTSIIDQYEHQHLTIDKKPVRAQETEYTIEEEDINIGINGFQERGTWTSCSPLRKIKIVQKWNTGHKKWVK